MGKKEDEKKGGIFIAPDITKRKQLKTIRTIATEYAQYSLMSNRYLLI